jgi:hypothetical protein
MSKKGLHFLAPPKPSTILFSALLFITGVIQAQERIGVAAAVDTTTTDLTLEQERKLVDEGYKIIQNHTIETDENGKAQMLLVDGTAFTVGPNSSVTLDSFIYNPETAEGSLTVTSRGLMRLVGGKVTKNNPAIIRTNAATVGIRGGIVFVDSQGETTEASFIYGDEMTVTPALNQDGTYVLTRNGFVVVVDDPLEDVEDVSLLTAEQLLAMQESLQGSPEEEESEEESSEEGEAEEEQTEEEESEEEESEEEAEEEGETEEESSEEESEEESSEEESSEDSSEEDSSEDSESGSDTEDSSDNESGDEAGAEDDASDSGSDSSESESDVGSDESLETETETDSEPEIDESALDSSGISDNSSDVEPDQLTTATDIDTGNDFDVETETENEPAEETEVVEDVTEVAQETAADESVGAPEVDIVATPSVIENEDSKTIATLSITNPGDAEINFEITGEDSDKVVFNPDTNSIELISALDHETNDTLDITLVVTDDQGNIQLNDISIDVEDVNEAPSMLSMSHNNLISANASINDVRANASNISETSELGSVVADITVADPDGDTVQYTLAGSGSDNFAISNSGEITLTSELNFEAQSQFTIQVVSSDGINEIVQDVVIYVVNDNEAPSVTLDNFTVAENAASGTTLATATGLDPEGSNVSYFLSGQGSDNFQIDADGNITLDGTLDYEGTQSYELTVFASDGLFTVPKTVTVTVTNANEAPSVSAAVAFNSFQETTAVGTTIATTTGIDPESDTISYSLSGTGSDKFSVDAEGKITLASSLDYETATSYSINLNASDGSNVTTKTLTINVGNVAEISYSGTLAASSQNESIATGSAILSSSTSGAEGTVTYSISDPDNKFAINSATGEVTLANALDHETKTSHSFTVTASDGSNTESQTFTLQINDVDLSLSASLASGSQLETVSTGAAILSSSTTNAEGTVTYSLTDADNKFAINSSTGQVTLANALDYETKTSHTFTVTATDGTTTTSETFTLNIGDVNLGGLVTSQSTPALENTSSGTGLYNVSSIESDGGSPTYGITAGNNAGLFAVNSSTGAISATATALDFETAKTHTLTLTATQGGDTTSTNIVVPVTNQNEIDSVVLRYSADYHAVSRSGFAATATRGPSGSSLPNYYLEQIGTAPTDDITDVDNTSNNSVPVEIAGGTALNWRYFFPTDTGGNGQFAFAPNSASVDGKYKSLLGTSVETTISNSEVISAGRMKGGNFWFMTTDKAAQNISYASTTGAQRTYAVIHSNNVNYSGTGSNSWQTLLQNQGYTVEVCGTSSVMQTCLNAAGISLDDVGVMILPGLGTTNIGYQNSDIADWIDDGGIYYQVMWEHSGGCCGATNNMTFAQGIFNALNWSGLSGASGMGSGFTIGQSDIDAITNNGGTLDYSGLLNKQYRDASSGVLNIPSICNSLGGSANGIFVCDPGRTGSLGVVIGHADVNPFASSRTQLDNNDIMAWITGLGSGTSSTYNLFEDQVTIAGRVDEGFPSNTSLHVYAFAVIPREHFSSSGTSNDYFYPNFIPRSIWSYGDVGVDYCLAVDTQSNCNSDYSNAYQWHELAFRTGSGSIIHSSRFGWSDNNVPEGMSLWYQHIDDDVFTEGNNQGVLPGLWAQISFKDSYDGASGSTTRDDQESLLNVVISQMDARKNDTIRYSVGDTNIGLDGYHYWSYQQPTNANDNSSAIVYGTSAIECATANDAGCFYGGSAVNTKAAMLTSSDPYKSGDMTLSVSYDGNADTFSTGSFDQAMLKEYSNPSSSTAANNYTFDHFRNRSIVSGYTPSGFSGFFSGILEFDVSGTGNSQLASLRSSSTLATFTFDSTYHDVQVVAPVTVSAAPANNYTATWSTVDTGSMTLKFGDADNDEAKSAYFSWDVLGAEIQDDGTQIDGTSGGSNNLAGVMVSFNTLDTPDSDLFHSGGNDAIPDTTYSSWGFWAMSAADISPNSGTQNASVHLGTWVGGEVLDQSEVPTSGSASMSGAAVMSVAYRYNKSGTDYDVHKYTTTADVAASFNWGASGYTGQFNFTNFDDKNAIVVNAGFTSFAVNISGSGATYTGSLADTNNGWTREAVIAGALYGDSSPDESGGRLGVGLSKSGALGTGGANDFYFAEGVYLID